MGWGVLNFNGARRVLILMEGVPYWGDPSPLEVCVGVHYFSESAAQSVEKNSKKSENTAH